jgi:hypothetical protein
LPRPPAASLPAPSHPEAGPDEHRTNNYALPGETVSTDAFIGHLDQYTIEYSGDNPLEGDQDDNDITRSQVIDEDWG